MGSGRPRIKVRRPLQRLGTGLETWSLRKDLKVIQTRRKVEIHNKGLR